MTKTTMYEQTRNEIITLQATSKDKDHYAEENYNNNNKPNEDSTECHIVKYYGTFPCPYNTSNICLAFEYMAGGSLLNMIEAKHIFTEKDVKVIAYSILTAMKRITELNYIHRDIKVSYH